MAENDSSSNQKRSTAVKINISDLLYGDYKKEEGWTPNFVKTKRGEVSRVNIIALVVSKDENKGINSLMIDDTTATIQVRSFENQSILNKPKIGEVILIIGRPREYNSEKYILAEIIKVISDKKWFNVRKLELSDNNSVEEIKKKDEEKINEKYDEEIKKEEPKISSKKDEMIITPQINPYEVVLNLIKTMDEGFGVSYEDIILTSKLKNAEEVIQSLIEEGEIFEIRPGILKVL